jgi:GNAT superfamily N-acetyltransferase
MPIMTQAIAVELRPAVAADGAFLTEMLLEAMNWHPERQMTLARLLAEPELSHYIAGWPRPDDGGVVAVAAGSPIGAAWWRLFPEADPGYGFVAGDVPELGLAIVETWRGRGVGRVLLRAAKKTLATRCRQVSLSVERANKAQNLYLSEGFRVLTSGRDSDTMICDLDPGPVADRSHSPADPLEPASEAGC